MPRDNDVFGRISLDAGDMRTISALVYERSGIALRDSKRALVMARLQKRLRQAGFTSFREYLNYLIHDRTGAELTAVLDAITTNHTSFFREPSHFHFLGNSIATADSMRQRARPLIGWSAACATGEEAYSIAITLLDTLPAAQIGRLQFLASDLSTRAIQTARAGIYPIDRVAQIPRATLKQHFERGRGEQEGLVRVKSQVRALVQFRQLNLIDIQSLGVAFDFIFCRNAMIYFDRLSRQRVVSMLERHLTPEGYLFVSQSEALSECDHGLRYRAPGVYQRSRA